MSDRKAVLRYRQAGVSIMNMMVVLFFAAAILSVSLKLVPIYIDNRTIETVIEDLFRESAGKRVAAEDFKDSLAKRLSINNIRDFKNEYFTVSQTDGRLSGVLKYEIRVNVFRNIDAVVVFDREFDESGRK